eukprot:scaffold11338_cov98-Isochrysis_galbana.AAC.2
MCKALAGSGLCASGRTGGGVVVLVLVLRPCWGCRCGSLAHHVAPFTGLRGVYGWQWHGHAHCGRRRGRGSGARRLRYEDMTPGLTDLSICICACAEPRSNAATNERLYLELQSLGSKLEWVCAMTCVNDMLDPGEYMWMGCGQLACHTPHSHRIHRLARAHGGADSGEPPLQVGDGIGLNLEPARRRRRREAAGSGRQAAAGRREAGRGREAPACGGRGAPVGQLARRDDQLVPAGGDAGGGGRPHLDPPHAG